MLPQICLSLLLSTLPQLHALQIPLLYTSNNNDHHPNDLFPTFNSTIQSFLTTHDIPALSIAITKNDRLVHCSAHGSADLSTTPPSQATTSHRFRIASVSKTLTATTILHLLDQALLSNLSVPVFGPQGILGHEYGSKPYSAWEEEITVRHLLDHSSGFVDEELCGQGCDPTYLPQYLDLNQWELVGRLLDAYEPTHKPGTVSSYSNFGYFILGRVVEALSGWERGYEAFVKEKVLKGLLGVEEMEVGGDERREMEVVYYEDDMKKPYSFHVGRRDSVGAWIATPTDLVRLLTGIDGLVGSRPDVLNASSRAEMFRRSEVEGSEYGLGWDETVLNDEGETVKVGKSGGYEGTNAWVSIDFVANITYAVVVNKQVRGVTNGGKGLKEFVEGLLEKVEHWPDCDLFED